MEFIKNYQQKRDFNDIVLSFIETEDESYECYEDLSNFIKKQNFTKDNQLLQSFIDILINIINNHHRNPDFFDKITQILQLLAKSIQEQFSNKEIFNMFSDNKRVLLILIENKIILFDRNIINIITNNKDTFGYRYCYYFPKEIDPFLSSEMKSFIIKKLQGQNFEGKRLNAENETYTCSLIRDDLSQEFISYVNRSHLSLSTQIKPTIYETNLMFKRKSSMIEYAAFYASIEIFHYLRMRNVSLTPSLWLYSIHSNNGQLIHILEENEVPPPNNSYETCLEEAIKCHHNNIATYILDKMQDNSKDFDFLVAKLCFQYNNFSFLPENLDIQNVLFFACKFGYIDVVIKILETHKININYKYEKVILNDCDSLLQLAANNNNSEILSILLEQSGVEIQSNCFSKCSIKELKLPDTIGTIHKYAFSECVSLTSITLPNSMTTIDDYTFFKCNSLNEVIIPSSVTSIGNSAFENCINLKNIKLSSSLKFIGESSFKKCVSIENIEIPPLVSSIEKGAFEECFKLREIKLPQLITKINSHTFSHCKSLSSIEIPNSVTEIDTWAFFNCVNLSSCKLPTSLKKIDECLFFGCVSLKNIIIPPVESIGHLAFYQCYSLKEIEILESVKYINHDAFLECRSLMNVKIGSKNCSIHISSFEGCPLLKNLVVNDETKSLENITK